VVSGDDGQSPRPVIDEEERARWRALRGGVFGAGGILIMLVMSQFVHRSQAWLVAAIAGPVFALGAYNHVLYQVSEHRIRSAEKQAPGQPGRRASHRH